jgi:phosphoglycolate phosphatase
MLLVFDWDGTLADSTAKIVECMQKAAERCRLPVLTSSQICDIIGLGLPEAISALYPEQPTGEQLRIREAYVQYFVEEDKTPTALFPGVHETLLQLHAAGHTLTVATGKSRRGLQRALAGLEEIGVLFAASRCADETQSKPHPQMLQELLAHCAVNVQQAVMVGDTHFDMEMAQRAGMPRIAVSYGAHAIERLLPFEPVACLDRFSDITPIIEQLQE